MNVQIDERTILAEDGQRLLVRIDGEIELAGATYKTWHHEIWSDREKYETGIHVEQTNEGHLHYCANLAGYTDEAAIHTFRKGA